MDRLYESANAVDRRLLNNLYYLLLLEYHLDCSRTTSDYLWPVPPPKPESQPHLYHNDSKVTTSIIRCKMAITERLNDGRSTQEERELILRHPVWKNLKELCNFDAPVLKNI